MMMMAKQQGEVLDRHGMHRSHSLSWRQMTAREAQSGATWLACCC